MTLGKDQEACRPFAAVFSQLPPLRENEVCMLLRSVCLRFPPGSPCVSDQIRHMLCYRLLRQDHPCYLWYHSTAPAHISTDASLHGDAARLAALFGVSTSCRSGRSCCCQPACKALAVPRLPAILRFHQTTPNSSHRPTQESQWCFGT